MPEIRINSRPCPNCGHRNVTTEDRTCERCGTSLIKARNKRVVLGSTVGVLALVLCGLVLLKPWASDEESWAKRTKNTEEPIQSPTQHKPASPTENTSPAVPEQQPEEKAKEEKADQGPVMFTEEEEKKTDDPIVDIVEGEAEPLEVENYSTFTADKEMLSSDYHELIDGARMIASDLDIRVESSALKEFNSKHFDRLADMLRRPEYQGKELYLVAISESVGSPFLAKKRAEHAKWILTEKYAIPVAISTFGFEPNTDQPAIGQRLEAWVR